jgi:cobalt-zinc-cadmium efflux system membrane fusion protein
MNNRTGNLRAPLLPATLLLLLSFASGCWRETQTEAAQDHAQPSEHAEHKEGEHDEHHDEVKLTPDAIARSGIKVEAVTRRPLTPTLVAPARVSYNTEGMAHVGAVLRGRVVELKVRKGDTVNRGDELLLVESPELGEAQSDFLQKRTALAVAGPSVDLAKSAYDRAKSLYEGSEGITLTDLQKRENDYKVAQGALNAAKSALTAAENKLHLLGMTQESVEELTRSTEIRPRYAIRAPIDGQVVEREVTLGELVSPEKEALLVLADMKTLWVLADVPEARIAEVAVGAQARVLVSAIHSVPLAGKVSFIEPALDPNTRSARVRIEVQANGAAIRPGMFAQAEITLDQKSEPVLAIPEESVQTVEGAPAVFVPVPGEEHTFARRPVTVGKPVAGWLPVLSGLKDGDQIVTSGTFILKADLGKSEAAHED